MKALKKYVFRVLSERYALCVDKRRDELGTDIF